MRIPRTPPALKDVFASLARPEDLALIAQHANPLPAGRYLHREDLRYRRPPEGLNHEQWWAATCLGRAPLLYELPLLDVQGQPFRFATPQPVLIDLHHIDRDAAGQIRAPEGAPIHENRQPYLLASLIEEAITSSQLEGAATTRKVAADMLREGRQPRDHGEQMIFNNYRAMEYLRELRDEPITPQRILDLHRLLTVDTLESPEDAGRLRSGNDVQVIDQRDGSTLHTPPDFSELPGRLEALCAFANADENSQPFVHPVLRAILLHFMLGYDHPFVDGNGRTARALFYWAMARSGYWLMEFVSISHIIKQAPARYVRAYLHTETDHGDTSYFLIHQLGTIRRAITALHAYIARKTREQQDTEQLLTDKSPFLRFRLNHRQISLLRSALKHPSTPLRIDAHQNTHGVVYQTARADLLDLESLGLFIKGKRGNAYEFYPQPELLTRIQSLADTGPAAKT
ncbi:Fic family protein [Uliginosibacterium sp. TH139]|nr:Fic family protein [Uliginosibacterium sp. TH139]PLK49370.1 Fic family protein [Uliginosibacterium sp. TH139]